MRGPVAVSTFIVAVLVAIGRPATAQVSTNAYVFGAPGAAIYEGSAASTLQLGGGAEAIVNDRVGVSGELGMLGPWEQLDASIGAASVNGLVYLNGPGDRFRPYATAGYTLFFRDGTLNLWDAGGGVEWRFGARTGLRFEIRDQIFAIDNEEWTHFVGVRTAVVFRLR